LFQRLLWRSDVLAIQYAHLYDTDEDATRTGLITGAIRDLIDSDQLPNAYKHGRT